jgi:nucleoside-diphosphate-sugar epimerase
MAHGAFDCHKRQALPPIRSDDYVDRLLEACREHRVRVLLPAFETELLPLARNRSRFRELGVEVVVAPVPVLRLCWDKLHMSLEMARVTDVFVPSWDVVGARTALAEDRARFPLLAKPKLGSGSQGVRVVRTEADLGELEGDCVLQPFVMPHRGDPSHGALSRAAAEGRNLQAGEVSAQLVFSRKGELLGRMATYNHLKGGVPVEVVPHESDELWAAVETFLPRVREMGVLGPLNVQGRLTPEGYRFFEMNARFTGITGLRAAMGFNEVEAVLRNVLEMPSGSFRLSANPRRMGARQVGDRVVDVERDGDLRTHVGTIPHVPGGRGRTVMVTGATGFLGRNLVRRLVEMTEAGQGEEGESAGELPPSLPPVARVIALVRNTESASRVLPSSPCLTVVESPEERTGCLPILGEVDLLYHLASGRPPGGAGAVADGLAFAAWLFRSVAELEVPAVIDVSSHAVYGSARPRPWTEVTPVAPDTPYGQAKHAEELVAGTAARLSPQSRVTCLRLARLFGWGEGMRPEEMPHLFLRRAMAGEEIVVHGGDQTMDLLDVADAVEALLAVARVPEEEWRPVYNVGSGRPLSVNEIARTAVETAREMGAEGGRIRHVEERSPKDDGDAGMDISLMVRETDWRPASSLRDSFRRLAEAFQGTDRWEEAGVGASWPATPWSPPS